ncbi:hypothetical protein GOP47_0011454 [Adiantum capillus-veneris]|uniref:Peroxidase n=1 Tax=Adiantum capillus-veneris TaxID=13818 RepID=A0A9D4UTA8_ADICA|nr:hypothetical protein GOP47_0011454 [Adiantum capillus-veneris]
MTGFNPPMQLIIFLSLLLMASTTTTITTATAAPQQLSATFYDKTCPGLQNVVRSVMSQAVQKEPRMAASILRLFFHDCFVQGCDASILLDDVSGFQGEKSAGPNANSVRGFDVIDKIKAQVEATCKGVVSCADILALAARDGVALQKGPSWPVLLGRRDSQTASLSSANSNIPSPTSTLSQLTAKFQAQGLSARDMVALSGAHTIGQARCTTFKQRLYNQSGTGQADPTMNTAFVAQLKGRCPSNGGDNNLSPLDVLSPTKFDKQYFANLQNGKGLLTSDQVLFSSSTQSLVSTWSSDQPTFFSAFTSAITKMGNLNPLTGSSGEIRANCRLRN